MAHGYYRQAYQEVLEWDPLNQTYFDELKLSLIACFSRQAEINNETKFVQSMSVGINAYDQIKIAMHFAFLNDLLSRQSCQNYTLDNQLAILSSIVNSYSYVDPLFYRVYANALIMHGQYEQALEQYDNSLAAAKLLDRSLIDVRLEKTALLIHMGKVQEAVLLLQKIDTEEGLLLSQERRLNVLQKSVQIHNE